MNPNYLLRDELEYERVFRGVNLAGDVHLLRTLCIGGGHSCSENVACLETVELLDLIGTEVA